MSTYQVFLPPALSSVVDTKPISLRRVFRPSSEQTVNGSLADRPRRSARHSRTGDLFTHLPMARKEDSILSLNTTISQPPSGQPQDTSMSNLPRWSISLARLTSLPALLTPNAGTDKERERKVNLIVCVTAVSRPVQRRTKLERAKGQDGTLWIAKWDVVAPPMPGSGEGREEGCTVVLWDKCAWEFGEVVRRGDVVLLENVDYRPPSTRDKAQLILSPSFPDPRPTILYRTLPRASLPTHTGGSAAQHRSRSAFDPADVALRPDLRVGRSDPGVRRVAEVVRWFALFIGGEPP